MKEIASPELYINRELSWLAFNRRVLEQAQDTNLPLFERLKFLGIFTSNLDEFFMVRVAGLKQQIANGVIDTPADGLLPREQFLAVSEEAHKQVDLQYRIWKDELYPAIRDMGYRLVAEDRLTDEQFSFAQRYFREVVFPTLTPLAVDSTHPFPHLRNKSLNLACLLSKKGKKKKRNAERFLSVIQVPQLLPRIISIPSGDDERHFMLLGELIRIFSEELFPGYTMQQTAIFRVTRNWDLTIDEEESEDLLSTIQEELHRRDRGAAVRLEIVAGASDEIQDLLCESLHLTDDDVYICDGPLQTYDLSTFADGETRSELFFEPFTPVVPRALRNHTSMFEAIGKQDLLLHHPYDSFEPVVRFIEEAAEDPNVIAIKQTFYRTSGNSPFVRALSKAALNGKQVTAFVEIKARFDEANNIQWAKQMEENGVHIAYGLVGLKTHCKAAMVVRREGKAIRRYVHLGTGNYNPTTAKFYSDLSFMSCDQELAEDVTMLFNLLTGFSEMPEWKKLAVAPKGLQKTIIDYIQREARLAQEGKPTRIVAKVNSLVDPVTIHALYKASQAGVPVDLIVRGICSLRPGVKGVSETIRVISVVDRFLEHPRVFAFGVGDRAKVFASSADWMPRNFLRRIETMFPIEQPDLRDRVLHEVLELPLQDNVKAQSLKPDGSYEPVKNRKKPFRSQYVFMEIARGTYSPHLPSRTEELLPPREEVTTDQATSAQENASRKVDKAESSPRKQ